MTASPVNYAYNSSTRLEDGRVLKIGGEAFVGGKTDVTFSRTQLYDPKADEWRETTALPDISQDVFGRSEHRAVLLENGLVMVAGGIATEHVPTHSYPVPVIVANVQIYDPGLGVWHPAASMSTARSGHTMTRLSNGTVLIVGGEGQSGMLASAELYNPTTLNLGSHKYLPLSIGNP
jgi:hypothetical protein